LACVAVTVFLSLPCVYTPAFRVDRQPCHRWSGVALPSVVRRYPAIRGQVLPCHPWSGVALPSVVRCCPAIRGQVLRSFRSAGDTSRTADFFSNDTPPTLAPRALLGERL
jgi:hypothetical protein